MTKINNQYENYLQISLILNCQMAKKQMVITGEKPSFKCKVQLKVI